MAHWDLSISPHVPSKHSPDPERGSLRMRFQHACKCSPAPGPLCPPVHASLCDPRSIPARVWVFPLPPVGSCFYFPCSLWGSSWRWAKNKNFHGSCVTPTSLGKGMNGDLPPPPPWRVSLVSPSCLLEPKRSQILCQPKRKQRLTPKGCVPVARGHGLSIPQDLIPCAGRVGCKTKHLSKPRGENTTEARNPQETNVSREKMEGKGASRHFIFSL